MRVKAVIAIDPGANGCIALYAGVGKISVVKMPKDVREMSDYFRYVKDTYTNVLASIEAVNSFVSDTDHPGKRFNIDKLLENSAKIKSALEINGIPYVKVFPQSWQGGLNLRKKGEAKEDRKLRYKLAAGKYYPEVKPTLWNSDALCILHFVRTKLNMDPDWIIEKLPPAAQKELF